MKGLSPTYTCICPPNPQPGCHVTPAELPVCFGRSLLHTHSGVYEAQIECGKAAKPTNTTTPQHHKTTNTHTQNHRCHKHHKHHKTTNTTNTQTPQTYKHHKTTNLRKSSCLLSRFPVEVFFHKVQLIAHPAFVRLHCV